MRIGLVCGESEVLEEDIKKICRLFNKLDIRYQLSNTVAKLAGMKGSTIEDMDVDYLIVVGSDRDVLRTLLKLSDREVPVICISGRRSKGFLAVADIENIPDVIKELIRRNYIIERRTRITALIDGEETPSALNEIAIFSKLSGKIIRYSLIINDEFIWRDEADGVIISTPTGSTAYALSAGGPIVKDADVFSIVPVNTLIPTHKPIVTSSSNKILISDLKPNDSILIIDGQIRKQINTSQVLIKKAKYPAKFVKILIDQVGDLDRKLARRSLMRSMEALLLRDLPPSAKLVFKVLEYEGALTTREIIAKTNLPARTVSYALKTLINKGLVIKRSHARDARKSVYIVNIINTK